MSTAPSSSNPLSGSGPKSNYTAHLLSLAHPHDPDLATQIYTDKIERRPLLLLPLQDNTTTTAPDGRTLRRNHRLSKQPRKSRKPAPLTAREKRALKIYEIPKGPEYRKWEVFVPLHELWVGYMRELLFYDNGGSSIGKGKDGGNGGNAGNKGKGKPGLVGYGVDLASRLMSGDFHGAIMKVVRSRCPSRVGIEGIMVKETKMCFELVTKRNQVKVIPKEHSIFELQIPPPGVPVWDDPAPGKRTEEINDDSNSSEDSGNSSKKMTFQIHGTNFMYRAAERGHKKFKSKPTWDL